MYQEIAVVHQYPVRSIVALQAHRKLAEFFHLLVNGIGNRLALSRITHRADQKEIGKGGNLAQIQHAQVRRLLGFSSLKGRSPVTGFLVQ
jgi:hypothetical protein